VFVRPANVPDSDGVLTGLGRAVDAAGFVTVDGTVRTSAFGVWAAGNVVDPRTQVITSPARPLTATAQDPPPRGGAQSLSPSEFTTSLTTRGDPASPHSLLPFARRSGRR